MWVKIEGMTSEDDALLCVAMGADALGFVFAPSKRQVTVSVASDIVKRIPNDIMTIGVFRDETPERVVETVHRCGLRGAQLHGHESPEDTWWIGERIPFVIKAFAAGEAAARDSARYQASAIILDAPNPGSGAVFDWRLAEGVTDKSRLVIAGGLDPDNVGAAIEATRCWGVDVATGVESSPGRKDPRKVRAFIANARAAFERFAPERPNDDGGEVFDWATEDL